MEEKQETIQGWLSLADEKLEVARKLVDLGYYDDAASRAYYGMFYAAKAALLSLDVDARSHSGVLNQFSQHFVKSGRLDKTYGRMLSLVMQVREASDYNPNVSISQENTQDIVADAESFVTKIKQLLA